MKPDLIAPTLLTLNRLILTHSLPNVNLTEVSLPILQNLVIDLDERFSYLENKHYHMNNIMKTWSKWSSVNNASDLKDLLQLEDGYDPDGQNSAEKDFLDIYNKYIRDERGDIWHVVNDDFVRSLSDRICDVPEAADDVEDEIDDIQKEFEIIKKIVIAHETNQPREQFLKDMVSRFIVFPELEEEMTRMGNRIYR